MDVHNMDSEPLRLPLFITWGGDLSGQIAKDLHRWLPDVIQNVDPFFSSESIRMGQIWFTEIASRLKVSTFGLAVITRDAMDHPWVHFEMGALALYAGQGQTAALLVDVSPAELPGALKQIQSASIDDAGDVLKVLVAINRALRSPLDPDRLQRLFARSWPELAGSIRVARESRKLVAQDEKSLTERGLEELLTLMRDQSRVLAGLDVRMRTTEQRSIIERLSGPGYSRGPLRRHLRELVDANRTLVIEEMSRFFGSPSYDGSEEEET